MLRFTERFFAVQVSANLELQVRTVHQRAHREVDFHFSVVGSSYVPLEDLEKMPAALAKLIEEAKANM